MREDVRARDDGLRRLRGLTRGTVVAGLAAAGVLSAVVAHAVPGRTHVTGTSAPAAGGGGGNTGGPAGTAAAPDGSSLRPPAQAPTPASAPPAAVSGGS